MKRFITLALLFGVSSFANAENRALKEALINLGAQIDLYNSATEVTRKAETEKLNDLIVNIYTTFADDYERRQNETIEFQNQLTEAQKAALVKMLEEPAVEVLRPKLKAVMLTSVRGLTGEPNWSALFYISKAALDNFYFGKREIKLWLHRNLAPQEDNAYLIAPKGGWLFLNFPVARIWDLEIWNFRFQPNTKVNIGFFGKEFHLEGLPKDIVLSPQDAAKLIGDARVQQRAINYSKICADGKIKVLVALGPGQKSTSDQARFSIEKTWRAGTVWNAEKAIYESGWESVNTDTYDGNLKEGFLKEAAQSDYVFKSAHQGGRASLFHLTKNGKVTTYKRKLENTYKIYQACPNLTQIELEFSILEPNEQRQEPGMFGSVAVTAEDLMESVNKYAAINGGQTIFYDGSCVSSNNLPGLYAEWMRTLSTGKKHVIINYFATTNQWNMGLIPGGYGGVRWNVIDGILDAATLEQIWAMPHNEGAPVSNNASGSHREVIPINVVSPGMIFESSQQEYWTEVQGRITSVSQSSKIGKIELKDPNNTLIETF